MTTLSSVLDTIRSSNALLIIVFYAAATIIGFFARDVAFRRRRSGLADRVKFKARSLATLNKLISGLITLLAYIVATIATLSLFADVDTILWMIGLFSAGFGFAARPLVSDYLHGVSFIFEGTFEVGDKVELAVPVGGLIEGYVEELTLRRTTLRAPKGELYIIPNGEIRVVRNFSRGSFTRVDLRLKIATADLERAMPILEDLGRDAYIYLPNILDTWNVLTASEEFGETVEVTVVAKARFGKGTELRSNMVSLIEERLHDTGIQLKD